ncbi:MAG: serine/threonine-protein kinase [Byssovorax sp.]
MKSCDACHRLFPDDGGFCPIDGKPLSPIDRTKPPTDASDKRMGATLCNGRYQIWRTVADGGMGRVYQALDLEKDRGVALKVLHSEYAMDPVSVERFKREFELSAALPHDYIVEVLDFQQTEDQSYALVMEYLEGEELRMLLKREKVLPPERVIRMIAQVALGLSEAHERKIVHRDLKPDNIFLCGTHQGDRVKILDFGSVRDNSAGAKKLTVMGTTIGSPFYMSPEQAQALPSLDHRADVWSMAAIVYECLTGRVPFLATSGPAILLAILSEEPKPPSEVGAAHKVPATLDPVMEEALAKNPDIRIPTIAALADRVGKAYGLQGTHADWAAIPQEQLGAQIREALPALLEQHAAEKAAMPDTSAMDAAFKAASSESAFKAGSEGGPAAFADDMVMGVPSGSPRWLVPVIAGAAVIVGVVIALIFAR